MSSRSKNLLVGGLTVLSLSALGTQAVAQTCNQPIGPDVIVGDITGPANYTAVGTIEALSLGTTSCNIGNANVSWIANNNLHPAIGGALYRYTTQADGSSRFEQVGQSWLKHGFTALTQNLCCSCSGQGGSVLGVGCSDPYTASRNGSQSGLGPKYQVNAHTGVFTYPPASGTGGTGNVYRRLQVDTSDLIATTGGTGATTRYFGETIYVTQDDATAGNQNNNASYREITTSGSGNAWTFGFTGTTQRLKPALRAWPLIDANVTTADVQVAGDGLFIIGCEVTPIAGGLYHYEYAVQNLNADRNGGSFTVPVGTGVSVTNVGFHDVTYRDGDGNGNVNYSGTDWSGVVNSGDVTWACETQAQNNNANAIRWASTYNFRFDANAAPIAGNVTLGLWKTGSPGSVSAALQVPGNGGGNPSFAYCFGDGSGTACPCGNDALPGSGQGCVSSIGNGGILGVVGVSSISADTLILDGSAMTDSSCLYFQGTAQVAGGLGTVFGDGLRCAGGSVTRLGTKVNFLGVSQYPDGGDLSISVKGGIVAPGTYTYQAWYRNAAAFCTASTFNLTNGRSQTWTP